jgi:hypothetical protein
MNTTILIVNIQEDKKWSQWYEIEVDSDANIISKRKIGDEIIRSLTKYMGKKYFEMTNPFVLEKLRIFCESDDCTTSVYAVGNERKRTLGDVYSWGSTMDEPSLKRRAIEDGKKKKKSPKEKEKSPKEKEKSPKKRKKSAVKKRRSLRTTKSKYQ